MNKKQLKRLKGLQRLLLQIRREAEHAEAQAAKFNLVASQVVTVGIIAQQAIVGKPLLVRDDNPSADESNTVQVWHSALLLPDGVGALVWDSEEYLDLPSDYEPSLAEARWRFVPFQHCPPVAKALLAQHVERLFDEMLELIELRERVLKPLNSALSENST